MAAASSIERRGPLLPEGRYDLRYVGHETAVNFGKAFKLTLWFAVDEDQHDGVLLPRHYNVKKLLGKPGKNGGFVAKPSGSFAIEYVELYPGRPRLDMVDLDALRPHIIVGEVKVVTQNGQGLHLPALLQYSVISRLRELKRCPEPKPGLTPAPSPIPTPTPSSMSV